MANWVFVPWQSLEHNSLEEALSEIADATTDEGETWWRTNDLVAAALEQFGRTRSIKRVIATSLGVGKSARAVEIRAEIARKFPPAVRYLDVRPAMYKECRLWPDPVAALEAALAGGWSAADTRRARLAESGQKAGKLLFRRREATMLVCEGETEQGDAVTEYSAFWSEEGLSPFADDEHTVFVSVRERCERLPETSDRQRTDASPCDDCELSGGCIAQPFTGECEEYRREHLGDAPPAANDCSPEGGNNE